MTARHASRGFTLLEVMVALAILGVALVAIVDINGQAIAQHSYAKRVSIATMLARSKMIDLESKFIEEGFTSDFDQKIEGEFSEEGWEDFRWEAEIVKPDLDAGNASSMISGLVGQLGGLGDPDDKPKVSMTARSVSGMMQQQMAGAAAGALVPMIEGQMQVLAATVEKAVREVRLRVYWDDGAGQDEVTVVTHFVVLAPAGQPGGESNDPELTAQAMATARSATPQSRGTGGGTPSGMTPGPMPDTYVAPNGELTGPGIPRPAWVPDWVPRPPPGARYNPSVQSNPKAPPFIWDVPIK